MGYYDKTPWPVIVRIQTNRFCRSGSFIYEKTLRVMKRLSDKKYSDSFHEDMSNSWDYDAMFIRYFPKEDGLYQVVMCPDSYHGEYGPEYMDEWHYEFIPYDTDLNKKGKG